MAKKNKFTLSSIYKQKVLFGLLFVASTAIILLPLFFRTIFEGFKTLGLLGIMLINFLGSATILVPAPSIISVGVGGNLYNPLLVALFASLGASLGETVGFLFGYSSKKVLNVENHKILYHLNKFTFKKYGSVAIFVFSFIPNPFFDGIGIIVGMSSYSLKKFLFIVFMGRLLRNILVALLGSAL
ncbi:MAG: hypothetical protein A2857_03125 [Candidatus Levybacteria bacterium RIFCSPHIGHO2_01_FULL_36_15]|nr:MAG: hypothetical protein A2857_03125 [Candidatus Levybacteria bacterium RIFCSPHIGHO2_01_FULL_36_15]OGH38241.1 MAG: hypothetical protein A2905_03355 [Candidatus Levybacteria bacterium RIFCSPLOWO2_01_FULL_36_10]